MSSEDAAAGDKMASEDAAIAAVRDQHERDLKALKDSYARRLEGFAGEVLEAYLKGADWETAFADFFAEHCHVFVNFSEHATFDLRMTEIHHKFIATLDGLLDAQLSRLDISAERCAELLSGGRGAAATNQALDAVARRLDVYGDFLTFGAMMRDRHTERTEAAAAASAAAIGGLHVSSAPMADAAAAATASGASGAPRVEHCRVLWDVENVGVPAGLDPFEAVRALERWLESRGWWGSGVDGLVSAFFDPDSISRPLRKALDRAGVEQVLASSKREDADRTLRPPHPRGLLSCCLRLLAHPAPPRPASPLASPRLSPYPLPLPSPSTPLPLPLAPRPSPLAPRPSPLAPRT